MLAHVNIKECKCSNCTRAIKHAKFTQLTSFIAAANKLAVDATMVLASQRSSDECAQVARVLSDQSKQSSSNNPVSEMNHGQ